MIPARLRSPGPAPTRRTGRVRIYPRRLTSLTVSKWITAPRHAMAVAQVVMIPVYLTQGHEFSQLSQRQHTTYISSRTARSNLDGR